MHYTFNLTLSNTPHSNLSLATARTQIVELLTPHVNEPRAPNHLTVSNHILQPLGTMADAYRLAEMMRRVSRPRQQQMRSTVRQLQESLSAANDPRLWIELTFAPGSSMVDLTYDKSEGRGGAPEPVGKRKGSTDIDSNGSETGDRHMQPNFEGPQDVVWDVKVKNAINFDGWESREIATCLRVEGKPANLIQYLSSDEFKKHIVSSMMSMFCLLVGSTMLKFSVMYRIL